VALAKINTPKTHLFLYKKICWNVKGITMSSDEDDAIMRNSAE